MTKGMSIAVISRDAGASVGVAATALVDPVSLERR